MIVKSLNFIGNIRESGFFLRIFKYLDFIADSQSSVYFIDDIQVSGFHR